jgi:RHS repeat-associated protein
MQHAFLGFNGERLDPLSGMTHLGNGYRAYNPVLMRFHCPDSLSPFGAGGINPYAYCAGDPVNRSDPSGHLSWQAILGIGLGVFGLVSAVFTAGSSIVAAGGVIAALETASAASLAVSAVGIAADVTAIASGATEETNPKASAVLGWVSLAAGVVGAAIGFVRAGRTLTAIGRRVERKFAQGFGGSSAVAAGAEMANSDLELSDLEHLALSQPHTFRRIISYLNGVDTDSLRATSFTMKALVESELREVKLPMRSFEMTLVLQKDGHYRFVEDINAEYVKTVRKIFSGEFPFAPPSRLSGQGINPLSTDMKLSNTIDAFDSHYPEQIWHTAEWLQAEAEDVAFTSKMRMKFHI